MTWRCTHCEADFSQHIYDHGALACPPDDEPKDDE